MSAKVSRERVLEILEPATVAWTHDVDSDKSVRDYLLDALSAAGLEIVERRPEPEDTQETCVHDWKEPVDSMYENEVVCTRCGCHGELSRDTGDVYWPAT